MTDFEQFKIFFEKSKVEYSEGATTNATDYLEIDDPIDNMQHIAIAFNLDGSFKDIWIEHL